MKELQDLLGYITSAHYWFYLFLAALVLFFFVTIFLTACWEKYPLRQHQPGAPEDAAPPSGYFLAMNEAAAQRQLLHCGNYLQIRDNSLYKCCISLWLTADQCTLIMVWGGKMAKIDYKRTLFISVTSDGREIVTLDQFGITDLSGIRAFEVVYNANFEELAVCHAGRLARETGSLRPFSPSHAMDQFEDLGRVRAEKMVSLGVAKFLDLQESAWRYTAKGAFLAAYEAYIKGLQNAQQQKARANIKRPGE
ncbi:MAG TPA: hypothetical protein VK815_15280 [Candidatus Acidoferrales bacterium]|jgi:hypothetical protein|nr:hypothetical protein [Candidatus Acidoferrales bacterium]